MAQSESGQERTEEPTPKRLEEARKKGQVPRSRELNTAVIVIVGAVSVIVFSKNIGQAFYDVSHAGFDFPRAVIFQDDFIVKRIHMAFYAVASNFWPIFALLFSATFAGPVLLNGFNVNFETIIPKLDRMDPLKGIQRMFSLKSLMELLKALLKFMLIASFAIFLLWINAEAILRLGLEPTEKAILHALNLTVWSFLIMASSLLLIASIDVPFQLWEHTKQLKMTRQEVRDEMKETEGRPEVKSRIRRLQQEMAQQRMMQQVPHSDVIVTNPDHYAVALKYKREGTGAPVVVAKGVNDIAQKIIEIGEQHQVNVLRIPLLARAIYFHTKLDAEIPAGLYQAVAHVLAYVYQLKAYKNGKGKRPRAMPNLPIPDEMVHEE